MQLFPVSFKMQVGVPKSKNSRPIRFALLKEVQEQIAAMLADNII
jgi:hypothetical protein